MGSTGGRRLGEKPPRHTRGTPILVRVDEALLPLRRVMLILLLPPPLPMMVMMIELAW